MYRTQLKYGEKTQVGASQKKISDSQYVYEKGLYIISHLKIQIKTPKRFYCTPTRMAIFKQLTILTIVKDVECKMV